MSISTSGAAPVVAAFEIDGDRVTPTEYCRGPWFADQQHGAAVMGLLTRFLEAVPAAQPMRFTRITVDLTRAVPMTALTVSAFARRDGRRVQSLEATISDGADVFARAVATRIRVDPGLVPDELLPPRYPSDVTPPFEGVPTTFRQDSGPSFHDCLEVRALSSDEIGNERNWVRFVHPLIEGETPSPMVRAAAVADMIMNSAVRLGAGWMSINPEVSLQIERDPIGEWLCTASTVRFTNDGVGVSEAVMYDRTGRFGRSSKSVLNTPR